MKVGTRIKEHGDGRLPLVQALKELKKKFPWAPVATIRKEVTHGNVPAVRSSLGKKARYYVRVEDLERVLLSVQVEP